MEICLFVQRLRRTHPTFYSFKSKEGKPEENPTQIFGVCDGKSPHPKFLKVSGDITKALELLYKVFWALNIHYPAKLKVVYDFLNIVRGK